MEKETFSRWKRPEIYLTVVNSYLGFISAIILTSLVFILFNYSSSATPTFDPNVGGMNIDYRVFIIPELFLLSFSVSSSLLLFYQRPLGKKLSFVTLIIWMLIFLVFGLISFDFSVFEESYEGSIENFAFSFVPIIINSIMIWFLTIGWKVHPKK